MGGRFGKLGDAKRKALIRKNRLTPPAPGQPGKGKPSKKTKKAKQPWPTDTQKQTQKKP